jgi:hypothetical protein
MTVTIEVDGNLVEFPDEATAQTFFANQQGGGQPAPAAPAPAGSNTGAAGQGASGFNEGLAGILGLPVDAATSVVEGMQQRGQQYQTNGVDPETGRPNPITVNPDYQSFDIENPIGGSQFNVEAMDPFIADDAPDTVWERYARSIGRDVGASTPFVAAAIPSMAARTLPYLGLEAASSVASGASEQAAEDAGGNEAVQMIAALLGGSAPVAAAYRMQPLPQGRTMDEARQGAEAAYTRRDAITDTLTPAQRDELLRRVEGRVTPRTPTVARNQPRTSRFLGIAGDAPSGGLADAPTPQDVHDFRQLLRNEMTSTTPGAVDAPEIRNAQLMLDDMDTYLRELADDPATNPNVAQGIRDTFEGNDLYRRSQAAEGILGDTGALTRAQRRASSTGTGGNVTNAMRQNIRQILDNEARRMNYTADELAAMERVVAGGDWENRLRLLGTLSPDRGGLPLMGAVGGGLLSTATQSPSVAAATLAAAGAGYAGREGAEMMTRRNIDRVVETILNGQPLPGRSVTPEQAAVIQALIASRGGLAAQEGLTQ